MKSSRTIRPGVLLIISSPSGAGKTTLCHHLLREFEELVFSVSYTTRPRRPGEREGVDYRFVDQTEFDRMVAKNEFAEWAEVHGNRYGTSLDVIEDALARGKDVLFDIDYQGGRQLRSRFESNALLVFVLPPSLAELERRLRTRATDSDDTIAKRLRKAHEEIEHYAHYDYLIINDDLDRAYEELRSIYIAGHQVRPRMAAHAESLILQAHELGH